MYVGFQATLPHKYIVFCLANIFMSWLAANRHRPQQPSCPGLSVVLVWCSTSTSRLPYSRDSRPVSKRFWVVTWRSVPLSTLPYQHRWYVNGMQYELHIMTENDTSVEVLEFPMSVNDCEIKFENYTDWNIKAAIIQMKIGLPHLV